MAPSMRSSRTMVAVCGTSEAEFVVDLCTRLLNGNGEGKARYEWQLGNEQVKSRVGLWKSGWLINRYRGPGSASPASVRDWLQGRVWSNGAISRVIRDCLL